MTRPNLTTNLPHEVFLDHYWLRSELTDFCRSAGLSTSGNKNDLTERTAYFLRTGKTLPPKRKSRKSNRMPDTFTPETVIEDGWTCSQNLRTFFEAELGKSFKFNKVMRDFIATQSGKTLRDAITAWSQDKASGQKTQIEDQFEYNRFTCAYYMAHPQASKDHVTAAWMKYRNTPRSQRTEI